VIEMLRDAPPSQKHTSVPLVEVSNVATPTRRFHVEHWAVGNGSDEVTRCTAIAETPLSTLGWRFVRGDTDKKVPRGTPNPLNNGSEKLRDVPPSQKHT
jgi:hypothetical protein